MFVDGFKYGMGTSVYADGSKYEGNFLEDEPNGHGTLTYSNESVYVGNFTNGNRDGEGGVWTHPNGSVYKGEWKDDKKHG